MSDGVILSTCRACGTRFFPAPLMCSKCGHRSFRSHRAVRGVVEECVRIDHRRDRGVGGATYIASVRVAGVVVVVGLERAAREGTRVSLRGEHGALRAS